jgi:hypothetical protein
MSDALNMLQLFELNRKQESLLNSQNSEGRNQWGGNRMRHVTYDNFCRAVVEDHTVLLLSASGSVRKEALCRIRKGSDASRVLYQEMTAKLACKHDKVECARLLLEGL